MSIKPINQVCVSKKRTPTEANLADFRKSNPKWLEVYQATPGEAGYSSLIHIEDVAPKFFYGKTNRNENEMLDVVDRPFSVRIAAGILKRYVCRIYPVRLPAIEGKYKGKFIEFYPGESEEIILDILRRLAAEGRGVVLDNMLGVAFSVREIRRELKGMGRSKSADQVKHSLRILNGCKIEYIEEGHKEPQFSEAMLPTLGFGNPGTNQKAFCRFSTLTKNCLEHASQRIFNFREAAMYKKAGSNVARQLHKLLVLTCKNFGPRTPYRLPMKGFLSNGFTWQDRFANNVKAVVQGVNVLIDAGRIAPWCPEDIYLDEMVHGYTYYSEVFDSETGKKVDAEFVLYPTEKFIAEFKKANRLEKDRFQAIYSQRGRS
ncbi:hypothetical protein [Pseudodesulfovibrio methanolicus]|uniref:Uncharacterized protein n=1 Tax=Pseudodesulfovibrio methanolicus TaxID=3126690 RepID=A0ABZ2IXV7_9BACT